MLTFLRDSIRMYKINLRLDMKAAIAYPGTFWFATTTIPLWTLIQIMFIETIYGQVETFLGYSKFENYILFGTYKMIQSLAVIFFYVQLDELPDRIRGTDLWSFDMMLLKPIDPQIFATMGRYWFGSISSLIVGIVMALYGYSHEMFNVSLLQISTYILALTLGIAFFYLLYFFIQTWLFWFEYLQVGEQLWFTIQDVGQYPKNLYRGWLGILLNIVIPVTLAASVPAEFLFGRIPWWQMIMYILIVGALAWLTRKFWQYSIKKYASFSS